MTKIRALRLNVLRPADFPDCTNGGVSASHDRVYVVCPDGPDEFDLDDAPAGLLRLEIREVFGTKAACLVPVGEAPHDRPIGPMAGGNYATTSDSRLGRLVAREMGAEYRFMTCLPIHDRYETPEMYEALCR